MAIFRRILNIFFENEYPQDIQHKFWSWFNEPANTEEKENALKSTWDSIPAEITQDTFASLSEVEDRLGFTTNKLPQKRSFLFRLGKIAAVLLLPVLSGLLTYTYLQKTEEVPAKFTECFATNGELKKVALPDGSIVTINSGSIIIYPEEQKGTERYVYLNGEAYFDVAHNEDIPFIVKTDGVKVEVLGTKFNVSAYPDEPNITTTLESGKVKLNFSKEGVKDLILAPNDKAVYNRTTGQLTTSKIPSKYIAGWREGQLLFTDASIHDILRTFGYKYGVSVYLNSDHYENAILTVKFMHGETLEESLQILRKIIPGFRYELNKDKLYIY